MLTELLLDSMLFKRHLSSVLVEHLTCNEDVVGSIPTGGSILGEMAE